MIIPMEFFFWLFVVLAVLGVWVNSNNNKPLKSNTEIPNFNEYTQSPQYINIVRKSLFLTAVSVLAALVFYYAAYIQ